MNSIYNIAKFLIILLILSSCGNAPDARKVSVNADERIKQNLKEGKGLKLGSSLTSRSGNFQFASSNPLWRATLEKLDFIPLSNVDYAGGVIITDWYNDSNNTSEEIKIAVKFLTSEIRSDALDITLYKKNCIQLSNCKTTVIQNNINDEIKISILKRAAQIDKENEQKKKK